MRPIIRVGVVSTLLASVAGANPLNPDVSVIGDVRATAAEDRSGGTLELAEVEIALVGPLNPYARAEVYGAVHGGEGFEIEEAKLLLDRYLPAGLGLTAGRYLLDFGQLNQVHAHAYPFIDRPLMHETFFGADGVRDDGVRLDWIAPFSGVTLQASAGALRGDVFSGGHAHSEEEHAHERGDSASVLEDEEEESSEPEIGGSGRLQLFLEPSRDVAVSVGTSVLHGAVDPVHDARATWISVDSKVRLDLGPSRTLVLNGEAVFGSIDARDELATVDPKGWFASADFRASRRWNLGGFAESSTERDEDDHRTDRFGAFVGMSLMEETTVFRLLARRTEPAEGDGTMDVVLQAIFGLGPHAPHRY